jgi:hypothetical protein
MPIEWSIVYFVCVFAYTVLCGGFHFFLVHVTENVEGFRFICGKNNFIFM